MPLGTVWGLSATVAASAWTALVAMAAQALCNRDRYLVSANGSGIVPVVVPTLCAGARVSQAWQPPADASRRRPKSQSRRHVFARLLDLRLHLQDYPAREHVFYAPKTLHVVLAVVSYWVRITPEAAMTMRRNPAARAGL